jgi:hypothetical protein
VASNKELETGLKAMVEDYHLLGGGRKKLSQLVAGHLAWFDAAERRGMGWRDIIRVLTAAGITDRSGKPLSIGTLSSTVWRKRTEPAEGADHRSRERPSRPRPVGLLQRPLRERKHASAEEFPGKKHTISQQGTDRGKVGRLVPPVSKRSNAQDGERINQDVLAFMDRARSVRQRSKET